MMGERRSGRHHFSLMEKNIIFTTLFVISLILQLVLSRIQNEYVVVSVYENQEKIQSISSLMNNVGDNVSALSDFRWNYSDKSSLISQLRSNLADSIRILVKSMSWILRRVGPHTFLKVLFSLYSNPIRRSLDGYLCFL